MTVGPVPVVLYHSVSDDPSSWIAPYTVSRGMFRRHVALILASGRTPMTVDQYVRCLREGTLPPRPVLVTFDDGYADNAAASELLAGSAIPATFYLTTGFVDGPSPGGDPMLAWPAVDELLAAGHQVGAHSVSHPQLDTLPLPQAYQELRTSRDVLEQRLQVRVRSFAYPHGYSSPRVRELVGRAGYESACAVRDAFSHAGDRTDQLARLTVTSGTDEVVLGRWLAGEGAHPAPARDRLVTHGWRLVRRARALAGLGVSG